MRPYKAHWIKNPGRRLHPARQKAIPLSRCARVRFAPPFVPKGEDKRGTPHFDHPLRDEGGRQARRTLLRSPSSERRGKTSTAHRTSITLFGTKGKTRAARPTSITPFGTKGEDKDGAPYFDHPLRNEGGRQARRTVLRSPSSERRGRQGRLALLRSPPSGRRGSARSAGGMPLRIRPKRHCGPSSHRHELFRGSRMDRDGSQEIGIGRA